MRAKQALTMALVIGLLCGTTSRAASPCGVSTGDRVELVVDNPDNPTLRSGMKGTVICFNTLWWMPWPVLVSFDNWLDGQEDAWWCTTPPTSYVRGSLWPLACNEFRWIAPWPDLLDGGEPDRYFQPQTLIAGEANQILEIRFRVVNGGRGSPWRSTYVDLYALSDAKITKSDYKLGSTAYFFISGGGELEKTQKVIFPTNIPTGFYYIGWIIDPANLVSEEDDETNNTAFLSSYRLAVSAPPDIPSLELTAARGGQITTPGEGVFAYTGVQKDRVAASERSALSLPP